MDELKRDRRIKPAASDLRIPRIALLPLTALAALAIAVTGLGVGLGLAPGTAQDAPKPAAPKAQTKPAAAKRAEPPKKPEVRDTQVAPPTPMAAADYQPVILARTAGVSTCLNGISAMSQIAINSRNVAVSTWNKDTPNDRLFNSVVGLHYNNQVAPQAISVLVTAPTIAQKCDGTTVQIQPSSLTCDTIGQNLAAGSKEKISDMDGIPTIQTAPGQRFLLMSTQGNGCVVVAVNTYFAQ